MKYYIILLGLFFLVSSCDKVEEVNGFRVLSENKKLEDYWINSIAFADDGSAWLGTVYSGVIHLIDGDPTFYNASDSQFPDSVWINDIEIGPDGTVWVAHEEVSKFDGVKFEVFPIGREINYIADMEVDLNGKLWMAFYSYDNGTVASIDGWNQLDYLESNKDVIIKNISSITIDHEGAVWMAITEEVNKNYLAKYKDGEWSFYSSEDLGFTPYWIKDIDNDSDNKIWGVIDYSLSSSLFETRPLAFSFDSNGGKTFFPADSSDQMIFANTIRADQYDRIWVLGNRSIRVIENDQWIARFDAEEDISFFTLEHSPDGDTWIGTNKGVIILNMD